MRNRSKIAWGVYTPVLFSALFLLAAMAHRWQQHDLNAYRQSPLVPIEFFLLITAAAGILFLGIALLCLLVARNWRLVKHTGISAAVTTLLTWAGVHLDAATLIYMT